MAEMCVPRFFGPNIKLKPAGKDQNVVKTVGFFYMESSTQTIMRTRWRFAKFVLCTAETWGPDVALCKGKMKKFLYFSQTHSNIIVFRRWAIVFTLAICALRSLFSTSRLRFSLSAVVKEASFELSRASRSLSLCCAPARSDSFLVFL